MDHFPTLNFSNVLELAIPKGAGQQERERERERERESHYAMSHHCVCSAEVIRFCNIHGFFFLGQFFY
jgi:hypothetical protein